MSGSLLACPSSRRQFQIEKPAWPVADNPAPKCPNALASEPLEGRVVAAFLVTPQGRVDTTSVRIVETSHPLFEASAPGVVRLCRR
jgi:hypothetical protein